jgi:3-methylcrotonyl-CoA carboxylase alpha subunit
MIAKLIVWDEHRDAALARMRKALADYQVVGVTTNIDFLSRLVACPAFAGADLDTGLIERQKDFLFPAAQAVPRDALLVATVGELLWEAPAKLAAKTSGDPWSPWHARDGWRMNLSAARTIGETTLARGKKLDGDRICRRTRRPPADRQRGCGRRQKTRLFAWRHLHPAPRRPAAPGRSRRRPRRRPDRADARQGRRPARPARPESRQRRAAADPRSDEDGTHHHRAAAGTVKAFCYAAGEQVSRWRGTGGVRGFSGNGSCG